MLVWFFILALFVWFSYHLQWAGMVVTGTVLGIRLIADLVFGRVPLRESLFSVAGVIVGMTVCFGTGFFIVALFAPAGADYIGFGLEPWNIPGTVLGIAIWIGATVYGMRRTVRRKKNDAGI